MYKFKISKGRISELKLKKPKKKPPSFTCKILWPTTANLFDHTKTAEKTNLADEYLGGCGRELKSSSGSISTVISVLQNLFGKPWNNLALCAVTALRPSYIRVSTGLVTTDARPWRVTVYLDKDNRTIRNIEQEVQLHAIGCKTGYDFDWKMSGRPLPKKSKKIIIWGAGAVP